MSWQTDILNGLRAPVNQQQINKMTAWNLCEGNNPIPNSSGLPINNPFNTKERGYGETINPYNGVSQYPNWPAGCAATVATIKQNWARAIYLNLVNNGSYTDLGNALNSTGWGTSGSCVTGRLGAGTLTDNSQPSGGDAGGPPTPNYEGMVVFTYAQLEGLWIEAGGNQQTAAMAAAIAMAESGGKANASNTNGNSSVDRGLWQINSSNGAGSSFDVMTNVRAAISMSNNGKNWRPWCTAYSDGACGTKGGSYLGAGAPYQKFYNPSIKPDTTVPLNATAGVTPQVTTAGFGTTAATAPAQETGFNFWGVVGKAALCTTFPLECLGVQAGTTKNPVESYIANMIAGTIFAILNPFIQILAGATGMLAGGGMMIMGLYMFANQTQTGHQAISAGKKVAGAGLMLAAPEAAPEEAAAAAGAKTRTWVTTTAAGPKTPARTFVTHQTTSKTAQGTHTRTVKQQLSDEAAGYNQPSQGAPA